MRPEFDSEIDSVLRGHARRGGASSSAWDAVARPSISNESSSGSHLDADEIAAFGEDAVPAAARARYSAHLADCDDCRRSVTQVAFAAGVADRINERAAAALPGRADERVRAEAAAAAYATRSPSVETKSPSVEAQSPSWRERLSSIFAPRAWRYAMPVVALFALGAVVFVAMRGPLRQGESEMARQARQGGNAEQRAAAPAASQAPEAHHANVNQQQQPGVPAETQAEKTGTAGVAPANDKSGEAAEGGELAKLRPKSVESADQSAAAAGAAGPVVTRTEGVQLPQAQPAPPPTAENYVTAAKPSPIPPAPTAAAPRTVVTRDGIMAETLPATPVPAERETRERARAEMRAAPRDEASATKPKGPQRGAAGRSAALSSETLKDDRAVSRRARGPANNAANNTANNRNDADEAKAKREEDREQQRAETRTVGGRRFRREGQVWIDTAYRSGQTTVSMRRGSEQYRTLVGDEPEIGQISRALGGEVVIVWKGRAYRVKP